MANNEGIRSEEERNALNYTPKIEYQLPKIDASDYPGPTSTYVDPGELVQPIAVSLWETSSDILTNLSNLETKISLSLKDDKIPVSNDFNNVLTEASSKFGYTYIGFIPFPLYKAALNSPESLERTIITDLYEEYHSDVNGNINAELYTDVVDMQQDWKSMAEFIKKALFSQLVPPSDLPTTIDPDDPNLVKVDTAEQKLIEAYLGAKRAYELSLEEVQAAYLNDSDSERFYTAQYTLVQSEKLLKSIERVVFSKTEVYSLVDSKMLETEILTSLITNTVDYKPYKGSTSDILINLLKQYPSRQSAENGLRKIQALIKLTVDGKSDVTRNTKSDIRNIASLPNKEKMNKALTNGVHLRNNVFGEVQEVMDYFDGIPGEESNFNVFAEHIVDSVLYADQLYEAQAADFYKIHSLDAELRKQKIAGVIDKHSSREVYRLLEKVLNYSTETNSWPTQQNLTAWVSSFMQATNLS